MDASSPKPLTSQKEFNEQPRFVTGSTMRHVLVMTATGSVGITAIFLVDFFSLLYVSWLGDPTLTAAVGLASVLLFIATSINIGLMIALGALVSKALGAGDREKARRLAASGIAWSVIFAILVSVILIPLIPQLLSWLGASQDVTYVAQNFLLITLPTNALMALGMSFSGVLRAVGDAKRAMYVTLAGGLMTVWLDPLLIFGMGFGVYGAAIATVCSRLIFALVGFYGASHIHNLVARPSLKDMKQHGRLIWTIALPAVLTNIATPLAGAFLAGMMTIYGNEAVAANSVIDRLVPLAFGGLFALSGAVGPVLGQNWGAKRFDRMHSTLRDGVIFTIVYAGLIWAILLVAQGFIINAFYLTDASADLVKFFCQIGGAIWFFNGLLFLSNASFNNLGFPLLSTAFNWGRATIGTMPLAWAGAYYGDAKGVMLGAGIGSVLFGCGALLTAFWTIRKLKVSAG